MREADSALEQAARRTAAGTAAVMEAAARSALDESRPGWSYEDLHLVLVDDRPGTDEDRAHFVAVGEDGDEARVVLARQGDRWSAEQSTEPPGSRLQAGDRARAAP